MSLCLSQLSVLRQFLTINFNWTNQSFILSFLHFFYSFLRAFLSAETGPQVDISAVDLGEFLSTTFTVIRLTCVEMHSYVGYSTVKHWIDFLAA